jgi:NAD(P) transhydrogenase
MESRTNPTSTLPYCIWTIPEVAMCGITEEDCLAKGIDYEVGRAYYRNNARGQIIGDTGGMLKIVFDPIRARSWAFTSWAKAPPNWCTSA